jgi:hypothetical protein
MLKMSVLRESVEMLQEFEDLDERITDNGDREHEYEPNEFTSVAREIGSYRWNNGKVREDPDDGQLGKDIDVLANGSKSPQGSGNYEDAAAVVDKLKADKRFSAAIKHIGRGLPDDKRIDKKPKTPNMYPSKPHVEVPDAPESSAYDPGDVKAVSDYMHKKFPGDWPYRTQDPRPSLKAGLAAGPGTKAWSSAGKTMDQVSSMGGALPGLPRAQRKPIPPPRPGGKLGDLVKQAELARKSSGGSSGSDSGKGHEHAKPGDVHQWKTGPHRMQKDGTWKKVPKS